MKRKIEFYFDVGSPSAYLAWAQLPKIASDAGVELEYRPVLLGAIFKDSGNASPASVPAKGRWLFGDLDLCANKAGIPLKLNSAFPINTIGIMRGAVAAMREGILKEYLDAIYPAYWRDDVNLGETSEIVSCLIKAGIDAEKLLQMCENQSVKDELQRRTKDAVERGLFGVPTMFVGGQMFFGQDRLEFVRDAAVA